MSPSTTVSADAVKAVCEAQAQEMCQLRMMLTEERMQKAALAARVVELEAGQKKEGKPA
jgi:BMFP domain-containing protein YqiC